MFLFKWNAHTSAKESNCVPTAGKTMEEGGPLTTVYHREIGVTTEIKTTRTCTLLPQEENGSRARVMALAATSAPLSLHGWGTEDWVCCLLAGCGEESYLRHSQSWNNWLRPLLEARGGWHPHPNRLAVHRVMTGPGLSTTKDTRRLASLSFLPKTRDSRKQIK